MVTHILKKSLFNSLIKLIGRLTKIIHRSLNFIHNYFIKVEITSIENVIPNFVLLNGDNQINVMP